jgi:steroid 5-alpha reductase family enzyme
MNPQPVVVVLGFCTAVMLCGWLVQQRRRNAALADLLWAACISASALYYGVVAGGALLPRLLVAMMGGLGGFRLFMHLLQRMLIEPADSRHRALRERAESNLAWMLAFFVSRAVSATLFSVALYVAASNPGDQATLWTLLAAGVYLVGLSGEAYSDIQLSQFRDQPRNRGRTCRRGLWRYSRHPNYFFAFVHWCSYALLAVGLPWPLWSLTLFAPALAAVMAFRRIPAVEAEALRSRGEDYRSYQETTSIFVPWLPTGWPNDAAAAAAWYTPPPPSRARDAVSARATPLPGARITPNPSSRLPLDGPITPQPQRVLKQRVATPAVAEPSSTLPAGEIDG